MSFVVRSAPGVMALSRISNGSRVRWCVLFRHVRLRLRALLWKYPPDPHRSLHFRDPSLHRYGPAAAVNGSVVEAAQQDPIIRVGWAALRMWPNVVDFAPCWWDTTTGDYAGLVPKCNGPSLMRIKNARRGTQVPDATHTVGCHGLNSSPAGDSFYRVGRYGSGQTFMVAQPTNLSGLRVRFHIHFHRDGCV